MRRRLVRSNFTAVLLGLVGATPPAASDWPAEGVLLCQTCVPRGYVVIADEAGGACVAWPDDRGNGDVCVQRVTSSGEIAPGWPLDGVAACTDPAIQSLSSAAGDGHGGVVVTWYDHRSSADPGGTRCDIYAQRILPNGSIAPGWPVNGAPVTRAPGDQVFPVVAPDGLGGANLSWQDGATEDVHLQHLTGSGGIAPGWPPDGLPICTLPSFQGYPDVFADGTGGAIVTWGDFRDGPVAAYAQRVLADGTIAPGWAENGVRIVVGRGRRGLMPDGFGGAYFSCATFGPIQDSGYYLQRFTGAGDRSGVARGRGTGGEPGRVLAGGAYPATAISGEVNDSGSWLQRFTRAGTMDSGWPEGGVVVPSPSDDERAGLHMVPDGAGGVPVARADFRPAADRRRRHAPCGLAGGRAMIQPGSTRSTAGAGPGRR